MQRIIDHIGGKINTIKSGLRLSVKTSQNKDIFVVLTVILVALASFGLGRLSKIEENREPVTIENIGGDTGGSAVFQNSLPASASLSAKSIQAPPIGKNYVASKNGAKYYLSWCGGVSRISEANKVWFATKAEAEAAGFTPAANCPGI
jgi:hypothetical protein